MPAQLLTIRAGTLSRPITIQQNVNGKWVAFAKGVRADVKPGAGAETAVQLGPTNTLTSEVRIRYRPGVLAKMRVLLRGRSLEIISVVNVDEDDRELVLTCREAPV